MSIINESVISLSEVQNIAPPNRDGSRINFSTSFRWATKGILAADGRRVKLEVMKLGGRLITSREAVQRFAEALTTACGLASTPTVVRTPAVRTKAAAAARKKLEEMGI